MNKADLESQNNELRNRLKLLEQRLERQSLVFTGLCGFIARQQDQMLGLVEAPRWVPVAEMLPERVGAFLLAVRNVREPGSWLTVATWTGVEWLDENAVGIPEMLALAWMPLPALPEGT